MIGVVSFFNAKHDLDFNVKNRGFVRFEALSRMVDLCRFKNVSVQELESIQPEKQIERLVEQFQRERTLTVKRQTKIDQLHAKITELRALQLSPKKEKKSSGQLSSQIRAAASSKTTESFTGKMTRFAVISCIALAAITCVALTIATNQSDEKLPEGTCSYVNPAYLNQPKPKNIEKKSSINGGKTVIENGVMGMVNTLTITDGTFVLEDSTAVIKEFIKKSASTTVVKEGIKEFLSTSQPAIKNLVGRSVCVNPRFCK